jgi:predicted SAM-dependent methyltransferase
MTPKQKLGAIVIPNLPLSRQTFDTLRFESGMAWQRFTNLFSLRRRRTLSRLKGSQDLSVNVGSGGKGLDGWVNIDAKCYQDSTFDHDIRRRFPLSDGSASRILAEHVIEHLDFYDDIPNVLREFHRILKPGGVLRIVVPDGERHLKAYCGAGCSFSELGWDTENLPSDLPTTMALVNHVFHQRGEHYFAYDFHTMEWCLRQAGFDSIVKSSYQNSEDPLLRIDQANHQTYSLYVEAIKLGG